MVRQLDGEAGSAILIPDDGFASEAAITKLAIARSPMSARRISAVASTTPGGLAGITTV
ncbi:MAG: hypothetical protein ACRD3D_09270 [Terriglobia bacterium]